MLKLTVGSVVFPPFPVDLALHLEVQSLCARLTVLFTKKGSAGTTAKIALWSVVFLEIHFQAAVRRFKADLSLLTARSRPGPFHARAVGFKICTCLGTLLFQTSRSYVLPPCHHRNDYTMTSPFLHARAACMAGEGHHGSPRH